jgi:hypothetical protein
VSFIEITEQVNILGVLVRFLVMMTKVRKVVHNTWHILIVMVAQQATC